SADVVARIRAMKDAEQGQFQCLVRVLPALLPPADLVALTLGDDLPADHQSWLPLRFTHALLDEILPTLTADEIESLKPLVRPRLDPRKYPPDYAKQEQPAFRLAAALGMAKELEAVVAGWPADSFKDAPWTEAPQWTLFGLGDPTRVDFHMR